MNILSRNTLEPDASPAFSLRSLYPLIIYDNIHHPFHITLSYEKMCSHTYIIGDMSKEEAKEYFEKNTIFFLRIFLHSVKRTLGGFCLYCTRYSVQKYHSVAVVTITLSH